MASKIATALVAFSTSVLLAEIGRRAAEQETAAKRFSRVLAAVNGPTAPVKGRPASPPVLGPDGQPVRRGPGRPPGSKNKANSNAPATTDAAPASTTA